MKTLVELSLAVKHRRGHGALYSALDRGWLEPTRSRRALASLPPPKGADGRIGLALDVSHWLRPDAPTSGDRLFCHVYGRGDRSSDQLVPGWPYSFVAALEADRTSWRALLDAVPWARPTTRPSSLPTSSHFVIHRPTIARRIQVQTRLTGN